MRAQHIGKPGLWIDIIKRGRHDRRCDDGGAVGTAVGAGEQPGYTSQRKSAQCTFIGIVAEADPAVADESRKPLPTLEHVIDRFGDRGQARQGMLLALSCFQRRQKRRALLLADAPPFDDYPHRYRKRCEALREGACRDRHVPVLSSWRIYPPKPQALCGSDELASGASLEIGGRILLNGLSKILREQISERLLRRRLSC
jgi:hypothetical protein